MIAFQAFRKTFGAHVAVDGLTLDIQRGETLALVSPDVRTALFALLDPVRGPVATRPSTDAPCGPMALSH